MWYMAQLYISVYISKQTTLYMQRLMVGSSSASLLILFRIFFFQLTSTSLKTLSGTGPLNMLTLAAIEALNPLPIVLHYTS